MHSVTVLIPHSMVKFVARLTICDTPVTFLAGNGVKCTKIYLFRETFYKNRNVMVTFFGSKIKILFKYKKSGSIFHILVVFSKLNHVLIIIFRVIYPLKISFFKHYSSKFIQRHLISLIMALFIDKQTRKR